MSKENEVNDEDLELDEYNDEKDVVIIKTHEAINQNLCGEVIKIDVGHVETSLITLPEMVADNQGLIHGGFIFGAADYAAMLAVNEKNVVLVGADTQFLSPVKVGDEVLFIARVRHKEGRKRNVHVEAFVLDIKVFEGEFKTVITERHVLKLHLLEDEDKNE
jgi:acyl-CoA thioesterase